MTITDFDDYSDNWFICSLLPLFVFRDNTVPVVRRDDLIIPFGVLKYGVRSLPRKGKRSRLSDIVLEGWTAGTFCQLERIRFPITS